MFFCLIFFNVGGLRHGCGFSFCCCCFFVDDVDVVVLVLVVFFPGITETRQALQTRKA